MTVRAKFKVTRIERSMTYAPVAVDDTGKQVFGNKEAWTIHMNPVYGNGDPNHENTKFWQASPSGMIQLGTVNADAVAQFDLEKEFYVDFTLAESPTPVSAG